MTQPEPKKALGQHWLQDVTVLQGIVDFARVSSDDTVLEIGPGLGTLTRLLARLARKVIALEYDPLLASQLSRSSREDPSLQNVDVVSGDIRTFDLGKLPLDYVVVANIPYYLTGEILRLMTESNNPPVSMTLLVQKEVAERWAAEAGQMSLSAIAAQLFGNVALGPPVPAHFFTPPPKVDSQAVRIIRHTQPLFSDLDHKLFWRVTKAGFAAKRKQLRSSLAAGLHLPKEEVDNLLEKACIPPTARAQELTLKDWDRLAQCYTEFQGSSLS
jgi:16S rRNA (adenine1518-N6/adenine1519-N6)-dimethyltransferase